MLLGQFPDQEGDESDAGDDGLDHDGGGGEPVRILAGVQHDLQRAHPDDQQPQSHRVDRQLAGRRLAAFERAPGQKRHQQRRPAH